MFYPPTDAGCPHTEIASLQPSSRLQWRPNSTVRISSSANLLPAEQLTVAFCDLGILSLPASYL